MKDEYENMLEKRLTSSQPAESRASPGGAAAVCRRLIYDPLSFACVFTGFWELHSIRAAGEGGFEVCFGEDKLKLDAFISAGASRGAGDSLSKVVFFDHSTQSVRNGNRP